MLDELVTRIDASDELTAEHSRAVASWCSRLAKRLGATKQEIVHLGRAGLIHDIGKVSTPTAILTAPRLLDDVEMTIMRRHARAGADIVVRDAADRSTCCPRCATTTNASTGPAIRIG